MIMLEFCRSVIFPPYEQENGHCTLYRTSLSSRTQRKISSPKQGWAGYKQRWQPKFWKHRSRDPERACPGSKKFL